MTNQSGKETNFTRRIIGRQDRARRAAPYQFKAKYKMNHGGPLYGWRDYLNGTSTDEPKFFSSRFVSRSTST